MREILFRGKRLDNSEWVEGGSVIRFDPENNQELVFMPHMHERCISIHDDDDNITAFESGTFYKVDPATVGQYTGLTDKNGKKIFEGDVITGLSLYALPINGCVGFREGAFGLHWMRGGWEEFTPFVSMCHVEFEVIGNIYDNPELMGGVENVSHP